MRGLRWCFLAAFGFGFALDASVVLFVVAGRDRSFVEAATACRGSCTLTVCVVGLPASVGVISIVSTGGAVSPAEDVVVVEVVDGVGAGAGAVSVVSVVGSVEVPVVGSAVVAASAVVASEQ